MILMTPLLRQHLLWCIRHSNKAQIQATLDDKFIEINLPKIRIRPGPIQCTRNPRISSVKWETHQHTHYACQERSTWNSSDGVKNRQMTGLFAEHMNLVLIRQKWKWAPHRWNRKGKTEKSINRQKMLMRKSRLCFFPLFCVSVFFFNAENGRILR